MNLDEREQQWLLNEKYDGIESDEYHTDREKLSEGYPVDYLIGHREFLGCHIDLSHHPLIPRNETEYWVKQVIDKYRSPTSIRVLDMCAGSGCIGIAILKHLPHATVDFAEINPDFVEQIQKNLELNSIDPSRYTITLSDLFESVLEQQYDLILTNPPYIATDRTNTVQDSVHDHEDHSSLYSNDDGLEHIKRIVNALPQYLSPTGTCYIEYDPWQTDLITDYIKTTHPKSTPQILKDQFEKNRIIKISLQ